MIAAGDAFLLADNNAGVAPHLFVAVTDPQCNNGDVLLVNVTTWRENSAVGLDESCLVEVSDHPFVKHRSFIAYNCARVTQGDNLEKLRKHGLVLPQSSCSIELLGRIQRGLMISPHASPKHKAMLTKEPGDLAAGGKQNGTQP